ncbi:MAG: putative ABC transporter permease [Atopobiaceae bacterium]|nr:putative ABC transporter permease [Atopobiaceae bacterium]
MQINVKAKNIRSRIGNRDPRFLLVQTYFAAYLVAAFIYAALCPPAQFTYDLSLVRAIVIAATSAVTLWQLHERRKHARVIALVNVALCVVLSALDFFGLGALADVARIVGPELAVSITTIEIFGAGCVTYGLVLDDRIKDQLTTTGQQGPAFQGGHSWDEPLSKRAHTWEFWRDLIMYFIVFSFIGHWAEILFCRLILAGVFMGGYDPTNAMLWDQWLFPFSAEGTALAAIVVFLHPVALKLQQKFGEKSWKAVALSFVVNGIVCTSIDFGTGMVANQNYELWDYRDMPFNFMGQVCLQNSMVYTIAATLVVWLLYPAMDTGIRKLSKDAADGLFWALVGIYVFLALLHFVDPSLAA